MLRVQPLLQKPLMAVRRTVQAATTNAAELLGKADALGSLARGKVADIIAVSGDPTNDVKTFEKVIFVMKGGAVVKDAREASR